MWRRMIPKAWMPLVLVTMLVAGFLGGSLSSRAVAPSGITVDSAGDTDARDGVLTLREALPNINLSLSGFDDGEIAGLLKTLDARGKTSTFSYDANGYRTSMTDANLHTTSYAYDLLDRLTSVTDPEGNRHQLHVRCGREPAHPHRWQRHNDPVRLRRAQPPHQHQLPGPRSPMATIQRATAPPSPTRTARRSTTATTTPLASTPSPTGPPG